MNAGTVDEYQQFLAGKRVTAPKVGFKAPKSYIPRGARDDQAFTMGRMWEIGRGAIFAACGLGKTFDQLGWAQAVRRHTGGPVLILAPLNVVRQTVSEGEKFGIPVHPCRSQAEASDGLNITNYEMLKHFDPARFAGVVLDESSCLKAYMGKVKNQLEAAFRQTPYKLCCTATPAPNDRKEIGNHAQFLGVMNSNEMLARWFIVDAMAAGGYRLKKHAAVDFWRWVASWAVSLTRPSDLGFSDAGFDLPELSLHTHTVEVDYRDPAETGELFPDSSLSATTLHKEMRRTAEKRAAFVADLVNGSTDTWVIWCNADYEEEALTACIPDAVPVRGNKMTAKLKEERLAAFVEGKIRVLVTKPRIGGYGLNLQYVCHHMAFVGLSYSFEDFHQCLCRSWRFGQSHPVDAHIISAETEGAVRIAVDRKRAEHLDMTRQMIQAMHEMGTGDAAGRQTLVKYEAQIPTSIPAWLKTNQRMVA